MAQDNNVTHDGRPVPSSQASRLAAARTSDQAATLAPAQLDRLRKWVDDYRGRINLDPLKDYKSLSVKLDLTTAHPSGSAQLFATGEARLSSLFREPAALTAAEHDLGRVCAQKQTALGFNPLSLVAGVATWEEQARSMPVLLYPLSLGRAAGERLARASLRISQAVEVNPELVAVLRQQGVNFDPAALLKASEYEDGVVNAAIALEKINSLAARAIADFAIDHQFVVGCFINPATLIARRSAQLVSRLAGSPDEAPLARAVAGDEAAARLLFQRMMPQPGSEDKVGLLDEDPHNEYEVGDVPNSVRFAARVAARGGSLLLDSPSNATSAAYALAIASRAVAAGKTVLYVPAVHSQKDNFLAQVRQAGCDCLVVDASEEDCRQVVDRRLVEAVGAPAGTAVSRFNQVADELVGIRGRLGRYFGELHERKEPWGVSAYQAIESLAKVSALPSKPHTRVRLSADTAREINGHLSEWGEKLILAGRLGEYSLSAADTPWFKASILSDAQAQAAYQRVVRLLDQLLPKVRDQIRSTVETCGFPVPDTAADWGRQVITLQNLRRVLDVFKPAIFERDLSSMLKASLSKPERKAQKVEMGYWERHRYIKEAKSLLRPGTKLENLHEALEVVSRQMGQWRELVPHGGWPVLPPKLDETVETYDALTADITALDVVLSTTPEGSDLLRVSFVALEERLQRLFGNRSALDSLPERTRLEHQFDEVGLGELVEDFHARGLPSESALDELQLAWWTTVFEVIVHSSDMIANQDGGLLSATVERFTQLDLEHVESIGPLLVQELTRKLSETLYARSQDANQLHATLSAVPTTAGAASFARLREDYPVLFAAAKPLVVATAATLAADFDSASSPFDLVILDACAHAPAAELLSVLPFARQAVFIADLATASCPLLEQARAVFTTVDSGSPIPPMGSELSAFLRSAKALRGLGESRKGAGDLVPTGAGFRAEVKLHWVDAKGIPLPGSGLVETTTEEIDEVVSLVQERAERAAGLAADYALSVITLSVAHAHLVDDALNRAAQKDTRLADLLPHVQVGELSEVAGLRPGDVILSTSFGKTVHGRLLQQFGNLERPGGDKRLLDALALAVGDCAIVTGFRSTDLDDNRLTQPGPQLLKQLLQWAEQLEGTASVSSDGGETADQAVPTAAAPGPQSDGSVAVEADPARPSSPSAPSDSEDTDTEPAATTVVLSAVPAPGAERPVTGVPLDSTRLGEFAANATVADGLAAGPAAPAVAVPLPPGVVVQGQPQPHEEGASVLLADLAARLRSRGYEAALGFGLDEVRQLPLVAGRRGEAYSVAVFTDDTQFMGISSLRVRHRFLPALLAKAGWKTVQVWSVGTFINPEREVDRIVALLETRA